jgi:trafficking protein particle complex subunit 9
MCRCPGAASPSNQMDVTHTRGSYAVQRRRVCALPPSYILLTDPYRSNIRLTLENISSLPVDFLRLSFEDSTIGPAQEGLSEGELSVFEAYETEYDLLHRRAFSWRNDKEITTISPKQKVVLSVTCLGKVGWYGVDPLTSIRH